MAIITSLSVTSSVGHPSRIVSPIDEVSHLESRVVLSGESSGQGSGGGKGDVVQPDT